MTLTEKGYWGVLSRNRFATASPCSVCLLRLSVFQAGRGPTGWMRSVQCAQGWRCCSVGAPPGWQATVGVGDTRANPAVTTLPWHHGIFWCPWPEPTFTGFTGGFLQCHHSSVCARWHSLLKKSLLSAAKGELQHLSASQKAGKCWPPFTCR